MADLKVGIPELLINIEMAIFGTLHIWAFEWKSYRLANQSSEVTDFYGNGKAVYHGGRTGARALIDAMNPLDLLKAIGRSARWLFVGRKSRMLDPSYRSQNESFGLQPPQAGSELTQHGTAYHGAGATISGSQRGRYGETPYEEDAILLAHAQPNPEITRATSPYASDCDDHILDPSGRSYNRSPSPYGDPMFRGHDTSHSDTLISPLREEPPMPIQDSYLPPPPPYPTTRRHS